MLFSSRRLAHFETLTSAEADRAYSLEIKDVYLKKEKVKPLVWRSNLTDLMISISSLSAVFARFVILVYDIMNVWAKCDILSEYYRWKETS